MTEDNLVQNAEVRYGFNLKKDGEPQAVVKEADDVDECIILGSFRPSDGSVKIRDISGFKYNCIESNRP